MLICPQCRAENPDGVGRCVKCMASMARAVPGLPGTASYVPPGQAAQAPASGDDSLGMGLIFGAVGTVAVALWIGVARIFDLEARFMIVAIGAAAGFGMALGARSACTPASGYVAAGFTIAALLLGNWIKASLDFDDLRRELIAHNTSEEMLIGRVAADLYRQRAGKPANADDEDEERLGDEAKKRWAAMTPAERERLANAARREIDETANEWGDAVGFFAVFKSIWGIGWTIMGVGLAFRLGSHPLKR
jgi:hypothetical protein